MAREMPLFALQGKTGALAVLRGLRMGTRALGRALLLSAGSCRGGHLLGIALLLVLTWFGTNLLLATELVSPVKSGRDQPEFPRGVNPV